jgi:hypothetical protein
MLHAHAHKCTLALEFIAGWSAVDSMKLYSGVGFDIEALRIALRRPLVGCVIGGQHALEQQRRLAKAAHGCRVTGGRSWHAWALHGTRGAAWRRAQRRYRWRTCASDFTKSLGQGREWSVLWA